MVERMLCTHEVIGSTPFISRAVGMKDPQVAGKTNKYVVPLHVIKIRVPRGPWGHYTGFFTGHQSKMPRTPLCGKVCRGY